MISKLKDEMKEQPMEAFVLSKQNSCSPLQLKVSYQAPLLLYDRVYIQSNELAQEDIRLRLQKNVRNFFSLKLKSQKN